MYGYYFDPTYILLVIGMVLSLAASAKVKGTFAKYSKVHSTSGLTGAEAAQQILHMAGITDVSVVAVAGSLTDHYDPRTRHECGHAIQDAVNYAPLNIRTAIVPAANIGSTLSWPLFLAGLVFSIRPLLTVGILLFSLAVLFQLVTLPVEFNASARALKMLGNNRLIAQEEVKGAQKVLVAAALTYVAALAASVLQLLRLIILAGGRDRD